MIKHLLASLLGHLCSAALSIALLPNRLLVRFMPFLFSRPMWLDGLAYETKDDPSAVSASVMAEIRAAIMDHGKAFEAFKETNDANLKSRDVVSEEKRERINTALDELGSGINAKLTALEAAQKELKTATDVTEAEKATLQGRVDTLEMALKRVPVADGTRDAELHERRELWARAAIKTFMAPQDVTDEERTLMGAVAQEYKDMSVGSDASGGFLAPPEYVREMITGIVEVSPMREVCTVRSTAARSLMYPKRTSTGSAVWANELGTRSETDNPAFGMLEIPNHELSAIIDISEQNLEDSAFNLEQFIQDDATEQFGVAEGLAFISGSGAGRPEGILTQADVSTTNSGAAATIADANGQINGLIDLYHNFPTGYAKNATWLMNRSTLGAVRKLKDGQNNYLWVPMGMGVASLRPNTILDAPYVEMPDMPSQGAGLVPIAFGDFKRGYLVVDRVAMSIIRDPFTQAAGGIIRFLFRRRVGGQVVLPAAIETLTCAV